MEPNTESKEVKENVESNNVVEDVITEVEIEDCSDNCENVVVELPIQNKIKTAETETKLVGSEKQDETEEIEAVDVNNMEGDDHSLSSNRSEKVVGDDREATNASPKTYSTVPVVTEQNVTECKSEDNKKNETVSKEIEGQGKIGCAVEGDKPFLSTDNIVENKEVILSENAETAIALLSVKPQNSQDQVDTLQPGHQLKGENWNNTIENITSDIDLNIEKENCELLKQQQKELLQRQQELVEQIRQQQLIAQQLAAENHLHQQQLQQREQQLESPLQQETQKITMPNQKLTSSQLQENISKYSTVEEKKDEYGYTQNIETYEYKESTNAPKYIDLLKIFTPATDANEIVPRNRKLYSSSAFYSPALHPTVEDQVELARRISHSLSDISNQKSKGQSMYVNRKKRSVKWVHEGAGQDYHQQQSQLKPATSPSILPAYSDAGKHRVQLNLHQEQVLEKYVKPGLKVVKTPWEAALETGSASTAFIDDVQRTQHIKTSTLSPVLATDYKSRDPNTADTVAYKNGFTADYSITPSHEQPQTYFPAVKPNFGHNPQRELAYKPSLAKGWKALSPSLPKELYLPKEISLDSYAPPPVVTIKEPENFKSSRSLASTTLPRTGTFPLTKPNPVRIRSYCQPNISGSVQQETSQLVPQINYNTSPLPYDKIAKFENVGEQAQNNDYNPQIRRLSVKSNVDKIQNILPISFGEKSASVEWLTTSPYHSKFPKTDINYIRTPSPVYTKQINTTALLHGQNYNNTARGWKSSDICSYKTPCDNSLKPSNVGSCGIYQQMPFTAESSLPYTDF